MYSNTKELNTFIKYVLSFCNIVGDYQIDDIDLRRISLSFNNKTANYIIRTWNINENGLEFTLYKMNGDHGEDIFSNRYCFNTHQFTRDNLGFTLPFIYWSTEQ